jgi:hypothetical protein
MNIKTLSSGLLFASLFCVPLTSCGPSDDEILAVQQAEDAGMARDSLENELVETMDEINRNLDVIKEKQGMISLEGNSEDISKKTEILHNISIINDLIDANRRKIDELTIQAKKLGKEKSALARIAEQTRARIKKQEEEIADLKARLEQESYKVEDLNRKLDEVRSDNEALQAEAEMLLKGNAELEKNLNKAYFTYGTSQQLAEKGIVEKKGGLFGLGSKDALTSAYFKNKASFTELDLRETSTIPIQGKKPLLLTSHPQGSYQLKSEGDYSQLVIIDAGDFWSTSRFLIIEVR